VTLSPSISIKTTKDAVKVLNSQNTGRNRKRGKEEG
jgi:hypothetical protein